MTRTRGQRGNKGRAKKYEVISLEGPLVRKAREHLALRQLDLETYIAMNLRLMIRTVAAIKLSDTMPFGKYQGELVGNVVRAYPDYIEWVINESNTKARFETDVLALLDEVQGAIAARAQQEQQPHPKPHLGSTRRYSSISSVPDPNPLEKEIPY